MKVLVVVLITLFFLGCGVETDSSVSTLTAAGSNGDDNTTTGNDSNNTDDNTTDPTDGDGGTVVIDDSSSAGFSQTDAENDPNACDINDIYQVISDSSFDPNASADALNGLTILSQYLYSVDLEATKVALFYPSLANQKLDSSIYIYEDNYQISFDKAWEINANARVYVRIPKDIYGAYSCYRYELDSVSGGSITKTKVYR